MLTINNGLGKSNKPPSMQFSFCFCKPVQSS